MPKVVDLVKKAVTAAEQAKYFAELCEARFKKLKDLAKGSVGVDTADEINLLLQILSLSRATAAQYEKCVEVSKQARSAANGKLNEDDDDKLKKAVDEAKEAKDDANGPKEEAEALLDAGPILRNVTCLIDEFLSVPNNKTRIYERLEDCDKAAEIAGQAQTKSKGKNLVKTSSDMIFIAESLPIIHGIIHVAISRQSLSQAIKWIREYWGETANSLIVLSALVFTYVADKGVADTTSDEKRAETWRRIAKRVQKFAGS